jgi:DNA-binding response OmpR family regulator
MAKILIVDDDIAIREMLQTFLESDFQVVLASNGLQALEKNIIEQPCLIISDWKMPVMNGIEFSAKISSLDNPSPIIIMTGQSYVSPEDYAWLRSLKAFRGLIKKPFDLKELRSKIEAVLKAS